MLSRNDYKVLTTILQFGCTNEMKSVTIKKMSELTNLSIGKIRLSVKAFLELEYIAEGVVQHNAKTYYITDEGKSKLNQLMEE